MTIVIAENGHFFTQIPQPVHKTSFMTDMFSEFSTTHSLPDLFTGQNLTHSVPHFFEWQLSTSSAAILLTKLDQPYKNASKILGNVNSLIHISVLLSA